MIDINQIPIAWRGCAISLPGQQKAPNSWRMWPARPSVGLLVQGYGGTMGGPVHLCQVFQDRESVGVTALQPVQIAFVGIMRSGARSRAE